MNYHIITDNYNGLQVESFNDFPEMYGRLTAILGQTPERHANFGLFTSDFGLTGHLMHKGHWTTSHNRDKITVVRGESPFVSTARLLVEMSSTDLKISREQGQRLLYGTLNNPTLDKAYTDLRDTMAKVADQMRSLTVTSGPLNPYSAEMRKIIDSFEPKARPIKVETVRGTEIHGKVETTEADKRLRRARQQVASLRDANSKLINRNAELVEQLRKTQLAAEGWKDDAKALQNQLDGLAGNVVTAQFEVNEDGIVGVSPVDVKRVMRQDDGSLTVVLDYWPEPKTAAKFNPDLDAERLRNIARGLSYNKQVEAAQKHTLNEIAMRLSSGGYQALDKATARLQDENTKLHNELNRLAQKPYEPLSPSEALYGFMAWLTTNDRPVTFSKLHAPCTAVKLVERFCKANSLPGPRSDYHKRFKMPEVQ